MASSETKPQTDAQQVLSTDTCDMETNAVVGSDLIRRSAMYRMFDFSKKTTRSLVGGGDGLNSLTERAYAERLCRYNVDLKKRGSRADALDEMWSIADHVEAADLWTVVDLMAGSVTPDRGGTSYVRDTTANQLATVAAARAHLEKRYVTALRCSYSCISSACVSNTYQMARTFANVYVTTSSWYAGGPHLATFDGVPAWPLLYCLLRCGDLHSATRVLHQSGLDPALFQALAFVRDRGHYADLCRFATSVTRDPFRRVVYALVAAADVRSKYSDVLKCPEDYLWLRVCQVRVGPAASVTYPALQQIVRDEYEDRHGDACPAAYCNLLLLTGQFERAVQFLFDRPKYRVHAVHVAVVLSELGLLYVSDDPDGPILSHDRTDRPARLNLPRIMRMYCAKFENQDVATAINYYYCLRHVESQGTTLFALYAAALVVETEQCDRVFGCLRRDGDRQNGILDTFAASDTVRTDVIRTAAKLCGQKLDLVAAAKLHELVGEYDKMLELTNTTLIWAILLDNNIPTLGGTIKNEKEAFDYIKALSQRLARIETNGFEEKIFTFNVLKNVYMFFKHYKNNKYILAYDVLHTIGLLPLSVNQVEDKLNAFAKCDVFILNIITLVMLATMHMMFEQYRQIYIKASVDIDMDPEQKEAQLEYIGETVRAVLLLMKRTPSQIKPEVVNRLVETET